jgi:hypothetical protein
VVRQRGRHVADLEAVRLLVPALEPLVGRVAGFRLDDHLRHDVGGHVVLLRQPEQPVDRHPVGRGDAHDGFRPWQPDVGLGQELGEGGAVEFGLGGEAGARLAAARDELGEAGAEDRGGVALVHGYGDHCKRLPRLWTRINNSAQIHNCVSGQFGRFCGNDTAGDTCMTDMVLPRPATRLKVEWKTLGLIAGQWLAFGLLIFFWRDLGWWIAAPLGACLVCLHGSLQHEALHGHPTSSRLVNEALCSRRSACGSPTGAIAPCT